MKSAQTTLKAAALMLAVGVCCAGCGRDAQEEAIGELYEEHLAFTVNDYLRAAKEGRATALRAYLQAGMAVDAANQFGERALGLAAERGNREAVTVLLEAGADPDAVGPANRTPLMGAAEAGDAASVADLLERGADPRRRDLEGWTALRLAAFHGHGAAVGELLSFVSLQQLDSAFLFAAMGGDPGTIDRMLEAGADVYRRTPEGQTALMLAAAGGHLGAARVLLERGANRFATDGDGLTAALHAGDEGVAAMLSEVDLRDLPGQALPVLAHAETEQPGTIWELDGARVAAGEPQIASYREEQLPLALEEVGEDREAAAMRFLHGDHGTVWVRVGAEIPGMPFRITAVNRRLAEVKGDGSRELLISANVRDLRNGREFVMTPGDPGLSTYTYVDLVDADGRAFRGRRGDRYSMRTSTGLVPFRVLELRPEEVLVERLDTGEVVALGRIDSRGRG